MEAKILLDLKSVERDKRQSTWSSHLPGIMPGICVDECVQRPTVGCVERAMLASSQAWRIDSAPAKVTYSPSKRCPPEIISLALQLEGHTRVLQGSRNCNLDAGSICLVDNRTDFRLDVEGNNSRLMVLQLPRLMVLQQYPFIEDMMAVKFAGEESGSQILSMTVLRILSMTTRLDYDQQWTALSSIVQLIGLLRPPGDQYAAPRTWRVHRAVNFIEANLGDPELTAQAVAEQQTISRRQLDRMLLDELGRTLSAQIWERRLIHAASQLQSTTLRNQTITQIAMASGFEDSAHFTRAFKKRFDLSPKIWRDHGLERQTASIQ